jgi:hypothetical protein
MGVPFVAGNHVHHGHFRKAPVQHAAGAADHFYPLNHGGGQRTDEVDVAVGVVVDGNAVDHQGAFAFVHPDAPEAPVHEVGAVDAELESGNGAQYVRQVAETVGQQVFAGNHRHDGWHFLLFLHFYRGQADVLLPDGAPQLVVGEVKLQQVVEVHFGGISGRRRVGALAEDAARAQAPGE